MRKYISAFSALVVHSFFVSAQPSRELTEQVIAETNVTVRIPVGAVQVTNENYMLSATYKDAQVDYYVPTHPPLDKPEEYLPDIFFIYGIGSGKVPPNTLLWAWNPNRSKYLLYGYEADVENATGKKVRVRIYIRTNPTQLKEKTVALIIRYNPDQTSHGWSLFHEWLSSMGDNFGDFFL